MPRSEMAWHPYARRRLAAEGKKNRKSLRNDAFTKWVPRRTASSKFSIVLAHARNAISSQSTRAQAGQAAWQYRHGMRIGKGVSMSQYEFDKLQEGSGEGTLSDPKIFFNTDTNAVSRILLEECEKIVKNEAIRLGMTCAIIRGDLHNTTRTLDVWTREVIMVDDPTDKCNSIPLLEPIDDHLTVAFGSEPFGSDYDSSKCGADNIQIQGHLFVNVEREPESTSWTGQRHETGLILSKPLWDMSKEFDAGLARITGKMPPWKRRHIQDGYEECSEEYWERGDALKRNPYNWQFKR